MGFFCVFEGIEQRLKIKAKIIVGDVSPNTSHPQAKNVKCKEKVRNKRFCHRRVFHQLWTLVVMKVMFRMYCDAYLLSTMDSEDETNAAASEKSDDIQTMILRQLQKVNSRLDQVKHRMQQEEEHKKKTNAMFKLSTPDSKHSVKLSKVGS